MRVKVTLVRSDGSHDDVVVTADAGARIGEIADTIARVDPSAPGAPGRSRTLEAQLPGQDRPVRLPADAALGEAWIGSGAFVASVEQAMPGFDYPGSDAVRAAVRIEGGGTVELTEGSWVLGRSQECDVVVDDPMVSKNHLRLDVSDDVEVVDLGSANGILVDGAHVQRLRIEGSQRVVLGDTAVTIESRRPSTITGVTPKAGPVAFTRSPRVEARYKGEEFESPEPPKEADPTEFPFLALLAPILMGFGMFFIMQRPTALLFVLMAPVMMIGNHMTQKRQKRKRLERDVERFEERLSTLREVLKEEKETERSVRLREAPATQHVYVEAMRHGPLLWTRRPEHWSFLNVRFGLGTMPSRNSVKTGGKGALMKEYQDILDNLVEQYEDVDGVPVVENLYDAGALGFAGPPPRVIGSLNATLLQLTGLHSPSELVVTSIVSPVWTQHLQWLTWIPHTSSAHSPIDGHHLADSASGAQRLLAQLEELISNRLKAVRGAGRRGAVGEDAAALERGGDVGDRGPDAGTKSPVPAVVVVISDDIDVDRARLIQLAEMGADAGVYPLWISAETAGLPAACRTFVEVGPDGPRVGMVRLGRWVDDVVLEEVDGKAALEYGRRLAPVFDAGAIVEDASDLPRSITMPALLGHDLFENPDAVMERWRQNLSVYDRTGQGARRKRPGSLRAIVGSAGVDAQHLDLRSQGPHALVGGTTGAGKSEFLQAWVLAMAAEYSPDRVTFLFVDYKGGSAFADCVNLPHCVGLVTDLSPHLVLRAITSLRAELHHREHLFNRKKAKDLLELEKRGDPETPPALVIVIDEFAALVGDVPEFVDGVVDVAQRGRSLGIHLIMATQRPAGVIKDNLRANTNMRVALRMADESDSSDVVDVKDAAFIDPSIPGRGLVKTGPGRVQAFQSGYAGAWSTRAPERAKVEVARLHFGREEKWEEPVVDSDVSLDEKDLGPNDQQRLVSRIQEAFERGRLPVPRRPWLDSLADVYDLTRLYQRTDTELLIGVADIPEHQAQAPQYFHPDQDGHLGIYGTGGSGKSTTLRTLAAVAGITPRGGPVHVYGLDFAAGALRMLEALPHVGTIAKGDDNERIVGLMRMLRDELQRRGEAFAAVNAASVTEYRQVTGRQDVPRILLLVDGFANFRDEYEVGAGRAEWFEVFRDILNDGRGLGMHVMFTADRSGAVPTYVRSMVQRNILLRMSDDGFLAFNAPRDIVTATSPSGRAVLEGLEVQVAVVGGTTSVQEQAVATDRLAESMRRAGVRPAPSVRVLPTEYSAQELPPSVNGHPVLGIENIGMAPLPFDPTGTLVVAGPPGAGRSNALVHIARAVQRANPNARLYLFAQSRSAIAGEMTWADVAMGVDKVAEMAKELLIAVQDEDTEPGIVVLIEGINEYLQTPADKPIQDLTKAIRKSDHLLVAEAETGSWGATWPLLSEVKNGRRGLLLQPENLDGDTILKTSLPRAAKGEFPVGRGAWIARGKSVRVQVPLVLGTEG
ncbi:FtsK/SpoIIIE domain-containing protein [Promicromonospora iranensis]|uniref:S-DNA-T family DNA segregation ATPase FtsK/SpoIIIE n=1 Tax=Promicromonospora iranensis TaxID=1105144 RepID=A0ABU2CMV4_9MICO|nr:FtsK/SpoIIIE domain-containing protein [Promicromonospora iranensis]MDR7382653.1 S-DNA-T family DNA segregation ATPase FtsK/SpoIIIE [Promicromonospora iranensis]